ncbi:hypothetical protein B0H13DRAFT_2461994 [Mycena leptocephala]|nr:hypothetical protein B0H13DRAFT_2461994 [Mycena leptocephala]
MAQEITGDPVPTIFEERALCGMYDELTDTLVAMGDKALGNIDCPDDFSRYQPPYSSNIEFRTSAGFEMRTIIVGEIAGPSQGTVMRAIGNYYTGNNFQPIDDTKLNVKDILALVMPTHAPVRLANFFENQTVPLRSTIDHEIGIESTAVPYQEYLLRPWMRAIWENSSQDDIIMVHMLPKYGMPAAAGTATGVQRRTKHKLDDVSSRSADAQVVVPVTSAGASESSIPKPDASQIKLGAYYDPRLLLDYGGEYFRHVKARLVQLDVRDATDNSNAASLHIFVMNDTDSKGVARPKKRKVYQINAHSIKILADSDLPVEHRSIPIPRSFEGASSSGPPPAEFDNFSLKSMPGKAKSQLGDVSGSSAGDTDFDMVEADQQKCVAFNIKVPKRKVPTARDFLDLAAIDDQEDDEDEDYDLEDDFIDRRLHLDDSGDDETAPSRPARFLMDEMQTMDPHEMARVLETRYRGTLRPRDASIGENVTEDVLKWIHTADICPDKNVTPVWKLEVARGREWDVVRTVFKLCEDSLRDSGVLSATASPSARGYIYIECPHLATVERIVRSVSFIRRHVPPQQISVSDLQAVLAFDDKPEIPVSSWVRYSGRGLYCGDLAWVNSYDQDSMTYTICLIPRVLRWEKGNGRPTGLKRPDRLPVSHRHCCFLHMWAALLTLALRSVSMGKTFNTGFSSLMMFIREILPIIVCVLPTLNFFSMSLQIQRDELVKTRAIRAGDIIRVVAGLARDCSGRVTELTMDHRVKVDITDFSGPSADIDLPISDVVLDYRVGDLVEVCTGPHTGLVGWVGYTDWLALRVGLIQHSKSKLPELSTPSGKYLPLGKDIVVEYDVGWTCLRPKSSTSSMRSFTSVGPIASSAVVHQSKADPYAGIEVKVTQGPLKGVFGIIKNTRQGSDTVSILTEGKSVNVVLEVKVASIRERHTFLELPRFIITAYEERQQIRDLIQNSRANAWATASPVVIAAEDIPIDSLPDISLSWPEVAGPVLAPDEEPAPTSELVSVPASDLVAASDTDDSHHWLLHPALQGKYLDVVVHEASNIWKGKYDNLIGVIENLPAIKRGKRGSVKVKFGIAMATKRFIKITSIFPLATNEFEGHVTREKAVPVLSLMGVYVVVIGPDERGRKSLIGKTGFTTHGGANEPLRFAMVPDHHDNGLGPDSSVGESLGAVETEDGRDTQSSRGYTLIIVGGDSSNEDTFGEDVADSKGKAKAQHGDTPPIWISSDSEDGIIPSIPHIASSAKRQADSKGKAKAQRRDTPLIWISSGSDDDTNLGIPRIVSGVKRQKILPLRVSTRDQDDHRQANELAGRSTTPRSFLVVETLAPQE